MSDSALAKVAHRLPAYRWLTLVALCGLLVACAQTLPTPKPPVPKLPAQPGYVLLLPNLDGSSGQVMVKGPQGEQSVSTPGSALALDGGSAAFVVPPEQVKRDFSAAMTARPPAAERFILYLQSGSTRLTPESQAQLPMILEKVKSRPKPQVFITGHSDTKGEAGANARLALERAKAIAALLKDRGLDLNNMVIDSHGDQNLLVPTPSNTDEPRNRRVEVIVD